MRMSVNAFKSLASTYAAAYNCTGTLAIYSGVPPTAAELETGFDPAARAGKLFSRYISSGSYADIVTASTPDAATTLISLASNWFPISGPALLSGTATYALFFHTTASNKRIILVPVGDSTDPKPLMLNKLQFASGETVQVLGFTHKISRVIPQ